MPATTKKNVQPSNTIEYQRQVINDMAGDLQSLFVGTAAINAASVQVAGGNISDVMDQTIFFYYGGFTADTTISALQRWQKSTVMKTQRLILIMLTIDDDCALSISDKTTYEFFSTSTEQIIYRK